MKKKIVEGPLGLKMREDTAREVERILKTLPKDFRKIKRKSQIADSVEVAVSEKSDVSWISTDSVDMDGEVVLPDGLDYSQYQKNPVVLWGHDYAIPPIGKALWIKRVDKGLKAKTMYADTEFASEIFRLVQADILKGKSVGFIPMEVRSPTEIEVKSRPDWKSAAIVSKAMMLEFSACAIPVNHDSLVEAVSKGVTDEGILKKLGLWVAPPKLVTKATAKIKAQQFDENAILMAALKGIKIDPDRIAKMVLENLKNRGRV